MTAAVSATHFEPNGRTVMSPSRRVAAQPQTRPAALRAPLVVKLVGANLLTLAILALLWSIAFPPGLTATGFMAVVIVIGLLAILNLFLVMIALHPLRDLEAVASRVWKGDFAARVEASAVADHRVLRVGSMFNLLLDSLAEDRKRMRDLAAEVIEVGDRERAALAAELHDSTAQRLAGLLLQVSMAARECPDPVVAARLSEARNATEEIIDEVRLLAQTVHPRVLDDLGLAAALQKLARESAAGTGVDIDVDVPSSRTLSVVPKGAASVLYRVAQEAVRNSIRHGNPTRVRVKLSIDEHADEALLEIHDDGQGFDLEDAQRRRPGMGLFTMRERVMLVDGRFDVRTAPNDGTTVLATIPLAAAPVSTPGAAGKK